MSGHPLARAPVDDDGLLGTEALRGPRDVHGRVAAAVDDDAAAEPRRLFALHRAQHRHGVEHARRAARGDVGAAADVRADGEERGVEPAVAHLGLQVGHGAITLERDAEVEDPLHLRVEDLARQPVAGDAEPHHAPGQRARVVDRHRVAGKR